MKQIYIDCGTHLGEGIKKHIPEFNITSEWEIYTFEANPHTFKLFQETIKKPLPKLYQWALWPKIHYFNQAVWIENGELSFFCGKVENLSELKQDHGYQEFMKFHDSLVSSGDLITDHQRNDVPIDGSSTLLSSHFQNHLKNVGDTLQKNLRWSVEEKVECFDFSSWLRDNFSKDDYILCKMDIEGAEFDVLKKCIADNTLNYIDFLDVEFHHFDNPTYVNDYHLIINELHQKKIPFRAW